jgi:glycosyltransferase involved in cell wall biosynthesis
MKILRIIYDWPKPWPGLAPHPYELTKAQVHLGHEIEMFVGLWPRSGPEEIEGVKLNTILREPIKGTIFFTSSVMLFIRYLSWRHRNRPDLINSHQHFAIWIYLYRKILKRFFPWADELKIPLVVHFHRVAASRWEKLEEAGQEIAPVSSNIAWPLEVRADKWALEVAAACVFMSKKNIEEADKHYGVDKRKCFVVESGVNHEMFKKVDQEEVEKSRNDLGLDIYDKVILNTGVMVERKNIHLLIAALKYLPIKYRLLLVGPVEDTYQQKLSQVQKENQIPDERIVRVGSTPYPEVPIAFQVADVFVLPSEWEGMPKAVMESLASEVQTLVSGFRLNVPISGLSYLENTDPKYIAQKIQEVVENPVKVDVSTVTNLFSWERRAQELDKVYEYAKTHYL